MRRPNEKALNKGDTVFTKSEIERLKREFYDTNEDKNKTHRFFLVFATQLRSPRQQFFLWGIQAGSPSLAGVAKNTIKNMTAKPDTSFEHLDNVTLSCVIVLLKFTYLNIFHA